MKRNLIIAGIAVLVVLGLSVGAYFYFFTSSPSVSVTPDGTATLPLAGQTPSGTKSSSGASGTQTVVSPGTPVVVTDRLVQISAGPVVQGEVLINKKNQKASSTPDTFVNYIERQSGNVFSYAVNTRAITRINNKTIPGIQSASWLPNASFAFVRYLSGDGFSTINTYALASTSPNGFFLSQNITGLAVSSSAILSVASGVNGSIASLSNIDGTRSSTVFTTPLTSLRASFAGKNQYLVFSKPSAQITGSAFFVDATGHFSRIAGPLNGLVALASPSGKWVLVSYSSGTLMQTALVSPSTGEIISLPISTIADKCVWTQDESSVYCGVPVAPVAGSYPDDWYQGAAHFSDKIWNIHVADRYAQMTLDFSAAGKGALDAVSLAVDPAKSTLVFVNKNDDSLWSYSL